MPTFDIVLSLRINRDMQADLERVARAQERSLGSVVRRLIRAGLAGRRVKETEAASA